MKWLGATMLVLSAAWLGIIVAVTLFGPFTDMDAPRFARGDNVFATQTVGRDWAALSLAALPVVVLCGGGIYLLRRNFAKPSY